MIWVYILLGAIVLFACIPKQKTTHNYNSTFGTALNYLSRFNFGFAVGYRAFTKLDSYTNFFLAGPTGSGKSSIITIPCAKSLARGNSSIIFNDVSGELWQSTSTYLHQQGYKILKLNFADSSTSESFNPLLKCKTISDIQKLAQIIIQNTTGESKADPFWENASIILLSLFGRYLVFHCEPEFRTLQNLQRLIEKFATDGNAVDRLFVKTDESLLMLYKSTLVMGDKTLQSVIATARTALNLWNDIEVCKTTATNSIDFSLLRKEKVAIFVCNPLTDLKYFKPLSALFFQSLFNHVLSKIPGKNDNSIFFVLDEFASMKFPDIAVTVSNIRKYKAGILLCMQDEMSLTARYGQAEAHQIKTNCGIQVYLKNQPLHTCKDLSQIMGKYTYEDQKGIQRNRELMTADEIRMTNEAIILVHNNAPLKYDATPYYKSIWMRSLRTNKPLDLPLKPSSTPPLIQFN